MKRLTDPAFERVLIIVFENQYRTYVMRNPFMRALAAKGIDMAGYFGVMHPSSGNYVATVAGELCNVSDDPIPDVSQAPPTLKQNSIVDLLESANFRGPDWRGYMQSYIPMTWRPGITLADYPLSFPMPSVATPLWKPLAKYTVQPYAPYMYWHNPFCRFQNIVGNRKRWEKVSDEAAFWRDLTKGELPRYAWFTPNMWNDGHYLSDSGAEPKLGRAPGLVNQLADWLKGFFDDLDFPGPNSLLPPGTLVVVTFDEADYESDFTGPPPDPSHVSDSYDGPNQIYTVLLGDMISPGVETEGYNHYSLLRTIEENFELGNLGKNDADANYFQFLWGRRFAWQAPNEAPVAAMPGLVSAAGFLGYLYVGYVDADGTVAYRGTIDGLDWGEAGAVPGAARDVTALRLAASGSSLFFLQQTARGLETVVYNGFEGWLEPGPPIAPDAQGAFAVTGYVDHGDQTDKLMLAYKTQNGAIRTMIHDGRSWSAPTDVGRTTTGDLALAVIGASLYLIYQDGEEMLAVSRNTADYNVLTTNPPANATTRDTWSPSVFPVAHYSRGPTLPNSGADPSPPYRGDAPLAAASLDGVVHLAHPDPTNGGLVEETFSIAGVMTPSNVVDHGNADAKTTSNGYGTLAEAGWGPQTRIGAMEVGGALSMCRFGARLAMLYQASRDGPVKLCLGEYTSEGR